MAWLNRAFLEALGRRVVVWPQNAIALDDRSQPQPDLALLEPREDCYRDRYPQPAQVRLVVEVADSTVQFDREVKMALCGAAGIPEMWLVDLTRGCVEVYRDPSAAGYQTKQTLGAGDGLAPLAFPDCRLSVAEVAPAATEF